MEKHKIPEERKLLVEEFIAHARTRTIMSDSDSRMICVLAEEVIELRNEIPCPHCKGSDRASIGESYPGGPEAYGACVECRTHIGKKYKQIKAM